MAGAVALLYLSAQLSQEKTLMQRQVPQLYRRPKFELKQI